MTTSIEHDLELSPLHADPVDDSNGHHVRIRRLSGRIDICGVFLVKLRELEQQQVEDGMRSRRRSASKGKGWSSWYEGDREPEDSARHAAEEQQRAHAENRKLAETRRRIQMEEDAWLRNKVVRERAWEALERQMERKRQRWVEEERTWREARRHRGQYGEGGFSSAILMLLISVVVRFTVSLLCCS